MTTINQWIFRHTVLITHRSVSHLTILHPFFYFHSSSIYIALTASVLCCLHWPEWSLHRVSWSWAPPTINLALTPLTSELSGLASQVAPVVKKKKKKPPTNAGDVRDAGSISESERFPWRRAWQPTLVFLPEKSHGQRSLTKYQT